MLGARGRRAAADGGPRAPPPLRRSPRFYRHDLSVYAARNGLLYTLNGQCSEGRWAGQEAAFRRAAASFRILNLGAGTQAFPGRL